VLISIDYDGTYSAAPALWEAFAQTALAAGSQVIICTGRAFPPDVQTALPIYCSAGQAKADYLREVGLAPDVWIDDDPGSVIQDDNL
jgi:hypothetical protein